MKSTMNKNMEKELYYGNASETLKENYSNDKSKLIEKIEIENTPFTIMKHKDEWYILIGKYRLSEGYINKLEALEEAKKMTWEKIMQVIGVMIEEYKK